MAKQAGPFYITGTLDGLTFYRMLGEWLVRKKSSLTKKQFREWACFARSRLSAARFGAGSKLASRVYRSLSKGERRYSLFVRLKRIAIRRMHEYAAPELIEAELRRMLPGAGEVTVASQRSALALNDRLPEAAGNVAARTDLHFAEGVFSGVETPARVLNPSRSRGKDIEEKMDLASGGEGRGLPRLVKRPGFLKRSRGGAYREKGCGLAGKIL